MHIEEHNHCFMHYFSVKTLSETPFSPPLKKPGYGARLNLNEHPALRHSAPVTDPAAMGPEDWLFWELGTWMLPPARTLSAFHASRKHHGAERNGL